MRLLLLDDVKHHTQPKYVCLLVQFEPGDKHYWQERSNWMPKDKEIISIVSLMRDISPSFKQLLKKEVRKWQILKK